MILLQLMRDMTKLKPNIRPPNNSHIQRDSRRAQKQLSRLLDLMDTSLTSPEVSQIKISNVSRPESKQKGSRGIKVVVGVDI